MSSCLVSDQVAAGHGEVLSMEEWIRKLAEWQARLKALAQSGLAFTTSPYERERYEQILQVAAEMVLPAIGASDQLTELLHTWAKEIGSGPAGYVTPKVVVNGAVFDAQERLLLIQRLDRGTWFLPGGWAEVGLSPTEVVVKEIEEETGLKARAKRLLAVLDGFRHRFSISIPFYCLIYECEADSGDLRPLPHECRDAGFFPADALPQPLHGDGRWASLVFHFHSHPDLPPYSD
ncbi:MAG: NUDIX hydrolase N-terminal domain-containing protein [Armatimonadetes bacterium]|nr:NUDIX hydrolase N-terminal domain-containing protein [Armatimonadota bacterium]